MLEEEVENFYEFVKEAISSLPYEFKKELKNVAIFVKDYPEKGTSNGNILLGLYEGVPNPFKGSLGYSFILPDKITLFVGNIKKIARVRNVKMSEIIREVLYHEIGHHLGFSEEDLRR